MFTANECALKTGCRKLSVQFPPPIDAINRAVNFTHFFFLNPCVPGVPRDHRDVGIPAVPGVARRNRDINIPVIPWSSGVPRNQKDVNIPGLRGVPGVHGIPTSRDHRDINIPVVPGLPTDHRDVNIPGHPGFSLRFVSEGIKVIRNITRGSGVPRVSRYHWDVDIPVVPGGQHPLDLCVPQLP